MREFTEQELVRREKAKNLKALGLDPFGQKFERTHYAKDIKENVDPRKWVCVGVEEDHVNTFVIDDLVILVMDNNDEVFLKNVAGIA